MYASYFPFPNKSAFAFGTVSTQRRFDVHATSITLKRRRTDVETTSCAYWDRKNKLDIFLHFNLWTTQHSLTIFRDIICRHFGRQKGINILILFIWLSRYFLNLKILIRLIIHLICL